MAEREAFEVRRPFAATVPIELIDLYSAIVIVSVLIRRLCFEIGAKLRWTVANRCIRR